jgi:hypothetical protein
MRQLQFSLICLAVLMILCPAVYSRDLSWKLFPVPETISTKQSISVVPSGWDATDEAEANRLAEITVFDGPPEEHASLKYDEESEQGDALVLTWRFDGSPDDRIWISCAYQGTRIRIKKEFPVGLKELRVTYEDRVKTDGLPTIIKIEYR